MPLSKYRLVKALPFEKAQVDSTWYKVSAMDDTMAELFMQRFPKLTAGCFEEIKAAKPATKPE